jgi:hypothetical protein
LSNIKRRNSKDGITPAAVDLFRRACALHPTRIACIRGEACKSENVAEHCRECSDEMELSLELDRMLGLKPWHHLPLDAQEPAGLNAAKRDKMVERSARG